MKKIFLRSAAAAYMLLITGQAALVRGADEPLVPCQTSRECTYDMFIALLNNVIQFLVDSALILVVVVFVIAGVYFVLYPANPGKGEQAKGMFKTAVLGLVLTLSAYLIVKFIVAGLGGGGEFLRLNDIFR